MEIEAIRPIAAQATPESLPAAVDQAEIDAFTRVMFGHAVQSPEAIAAGNLQGKSLEVGNAIANARASETVLSNPADMLAAQSTMLRAILEVDLMAKAAGSLAQGINKLVSMQ